MITFVALVGVTLIIVRGTLFGWLRRLWPALFGCSQCVGAWVGIVAGASGLESVGRGAILDAVVVGSATSVLAMLTDAVLLWLLGDPEIDVDVQNVGVAAAVPRPPPVRVTTDENIPSHEKVTTPPPPRARG